MVVFILAHFFSKVPARWRTSRDRGKSEARPTPATQIQPWAEAGETRLPLKLPGLPYALALPCRANGPTRADLFQQISRDHLDRGCEVARFNCERTARLEATPQCGHALFKLGNAA